MPLISVVIPTFKRPALLKRAIDSLHAQTFQDWNCFVSDDEEAPGETWDYLRSIAAGDPRFHITRNAPARGQAANRQRVMAAADGEWIKPLDDDDRLRPNCLAALAAAVDGQDSVVGVTCGVAEYRNGRHLRDNVPAASSLVQRISQRYLMLGMYLQDDVGGGIPTQRMFRRSAVQRGVRWEQPDGIVSCVDSLFSMRLSALGDSLVIAAPLVEWHQGDHDSATSRTAPASFDAEYALLRRWQLQHIDPALRPPSLRVTLQFVKLIRAINRASKRSFADALALAVQAPDPRAWWLAACWAMRRAGCHGWSRIPKIRVPDEKVRAALGR